jgi:phosphopantothenoylcysteine decarboxylase/phosphopantothenate--cysteine ligase
MHTSFAGKQILLGVTGSIALFKVAGWVSALAKEEALVDVVMTESSKEFVTPLTFASLSGRTVYDNMFTAEEEGAISHIALGREADCILVAPATAQTIARMAQGFADDLLTTTILAADIPVIVCPAMNVKMYEHPATQKNLSTLKTFGYRIVEPDSGQMACGEVGAGRLPEWDQVREYVLRDISDNDMAGQRVLVTAGPTREPYDPARFLSNRSSGKMGYALARTAFRRGAEVTLIHGPTQLSCPAGITCHGVSTAQEMYEAVLGELKDATIIMKSAAVADFKCADISSKKVKKDSSSLVMRLEPNPDILQELGRRCDHQKQTLVGFAAESSDIEENGREKLIKKNLDLIAVNNICSEQSGFEVDTNQLVLVDKKRVTTLPHTTKLKTSDLLWDYIIDNGLLK